MSGVTLILSCMNSAIANVSRCHTRAENVSNELKAGRSIKGATAVDSEATIVIGNGATPKRVEDDIEGRSRTLRLPGHSPIRTSKMGGEE